MAKVTLSAGITSLRGKIGAVYYRTNRSGTVSVCKMPKRGKKRVSKPQLSHRELFGKIASQVTAILNDPAQKAIYEQWYRESHQAKETMRQFLFRKPRLVLK